jgi:MFS family permease
MLLAANAAGALAAGIVLEVTGVLRARPRIAFVLVILWCVSMAGFALSASYPLALVLLFVAGFLNLAFGAMSQTLVQIHAPNHMRGRVIGLYNMCYHGMRAFSGVTVGMGGSLIGIHASLAVSSIALLAITTAMLLYDRRSPAPRPGRVGRTL